MTVLAPKRKWTTQKHSKFRGKCTNPTGHSGTKYRKKHFLASGPPGTPRGVCVAMKLGASACACGGHYERGAA